ncbi:MAG: hypothetical protein M3430_00060 [Acidobacteriota bacterium]|nr:hypothetical protein [Acidobacteriota bacterium]
MLVLPRNSTDADIFKAVRAFVELLAQDRYVEAYEMAHHEPEREWTPALMKSVVLGYGLVDEVFKFEDGTNPQVTSPKDVQEPELEQRHEVTWLDKSPINFPSFVGYVHYDLPLNGEWSDLTLMFDILEAEGGLVLSLDNIHVL